MEIQPGHLLSQPLFQAAHTEHLGRQILVVAGILKIQLGLVQGAFSLLGGPVADRQGCQSAGSSFRVLHDQPRTSRSGSRVQHPVHLVRGFENLISLDELNIIHYEHQLQTALAALNKMRGQALLALRWSPWTR